MFNEKLIFLKSYSWSLNFESSRNFDDRMSNIVFASPRMESKWIYSVISSPWCCCGYFCQLNSLSFQFPFIPTSYKSPVNCLNTLIVLKHSSDAPFSIWSSHLTFLLLYSYLALNDKLYILVFLPTQKCFSCCKVCSHFYLSWEILTYPKSSNSEPLIHTEGNHFSYILSQGLYIPVVGGILASQRWVSPKSQDLCTCYLHEKGSTQVVKLRILVGKLPWVILMGPMHSLGSQMKQTGRKEGWCPWCGKRKTCHPYLFVRGKGAMHPRVWVASSWKQRPKQNKTFSPGAPRGTRPCQHININSVKLILDFWPPELWYKKPLK